MDIHKILSKYKTYFKTRTLRTTQCPELTMPGVYVLTLVILVNNHINNLVPSIFFVEGRLQELNLALLDLLGDHDTQNYFFEL